MRMGSFIKVSQIGITSGNGPISGTVTITHDVRFCEVRKA